MTERGTSSLGYVGTGSLGTFGQEFIIFIFNTNFPS